MEDVTGKPIKFNLRLQEIEDEPSQNAKQVLPENGQNKISYRISRPIVISLKK